MAAEQRSNRKRRANKSSRRHSRHVGDQSGRTTRRPRITAGPYAVLSGNPDNPDWWRRPVASLALATVAVIAAVFVGGWLSIVLLFVAAIVFLPAFFQGLVLLGCAALETFSARDLGDVETLNATKQELQRAAKRVLVIGRLLALLLAIVGVLLYAITPGIGSYQASLLLVIPLFILVLRRAHRALPARAEWALAITLAVIGCGGYLVFGGAQWWNWGQFCVFPLVALVAFHGFNPNELPPRENWYGGPRDGPWGPP